MPEERVAIQPPSVEYVKLSGKWPQVQPWAPSWRSRSGPKTPACTRASCDVASTDSTRFRRPMSIEITGRPSSGSAARLPEMLDPPPNGITTASCSRAALTTAATWSSSAGRTTTSGSRPRSPRRWRIRSVRLLPRPCTTRSWSSVETCSAPRASSSSALSLAGSPAGGISRSSKEMALVPGRRTSRPRKRSMKGASSGLPSWVKETSSSPQPHHFIAAGVASPWCMRRLDDIGARAALDDRCPHPS